MHAADAEVHHSYPRRHRSGGQTGGDLDPEGVIAEKHVADARHQHAPTHWGAASASMVTATCSLPSTSVKTPATVAVRPPRKRSWASARCDGCRRTEVPLLTSTPAITMLSLHGSTAASMAGSHQATAGSTLAAGPMVRTAPWRRSHISGGISSHR